MAAKRISRLPYFLEFDGKQAEWVVVAFEANEPRMIEIIQAGRDPHVATASYMWNVSEAAIAAESKAIGKSTSPEFIAKARELLVNEFPELGQKTFPPNMSLRQAGKKDNHAGNYREGPETYAEVNGVTLREAKTRLFRYSNVVYSQLPAWWDSVDFRVRNQHYLINPFGRKMPITGPTSGRGSEHTFKQGYAAIPQSTVHDIIMTAQPWVLELAPNVLLKSDNHDSLLTQHYIDPREGIETCAAKLLHEAELIVKFLSVPLSGPGGDYMIEIEPKIGLNWGDRSKSNPLGLAELIPSRFGARTAVQWLLESVQ